MKLLQKIKAFLSKITGENKPLKKDELNMSYGIKLDDKVMTKSNLTLSIKEAIKQGTFSEHNVLNLTLSNWRQVVSYFYWIDNPDMAFDTAYDASIKLHGNWFGDINNPQLRNEPIYILTSLKDTSSYGVMVNGKNVVQSLNIKEKLTFSDGEYSFSAANCSAYIRSIGNAEFFVKNIEAGVHTIVVRGTVEIVLLENSRQSSDAYGIKVPNGVILPNNIEVINLDRVTYNNTEWRDNYGANRFRLRLEYNRGAYLPIMIAYMHSWFTNEYPTGNRNFSFVALTPESWLMECLGDIGNHAEKYLRCLLIN